MAEVIDSEKLYSEKALFSQGIKAGEFAFLSQDARGPGISSRMPEHAKSQTIQALEHLGIAL